MKIHLITGCRQLDSHYLVFCVVVSSVLGALGLCVLSLFFLLFTSFRFSFYSHATHLSLQNLLCGQNCAVYWNAHIFRCFWSIQSFVFVPSNPLLTHISSQRCAPPKGSTIWLVKFFFFELLLTSILRLVFISQMFSHESGPLLI